MKLTEYEKINAERYKYKLIVERLKKRIEECKTNSNGISASDDWVEYKFQIALVPELQKILEGKK